MTSHNRRKKILINKEVQFRFALIVFGYIAAYFLVLAFLVFIPLAYSLLMEKSIEKQYEVANAFIAFHIYLWPAILIVLVIAGFHIIRFSHRVVGPVYRMKQAIRSIREENLLQTITFRKNDFFKDVETEVNTTISQLKENMEYIRRKSEELSDATSKFVEIIETNSSDEIREKAEKIIRIEKEIGKLFGKK